uniref:Origin recognition complex subunit 3 n=1 Tax=Phallusia mammillata TaxID=59560 RepID=A0A6F9DNM1_9ASCI|nr:origin recognition complex subunit 3-like [Phallusia mammillata]
MDEATFSVSKGCFAFKGDSKENEFETTKYLKSDDARCAERWKLGTEVWNNIEISTNEINSSLQESMFLDLVKYIERSCLPKNAMTGRSEIPTAALMTGVNMPDHAALFVKLKEAVEESIAQSVVILQSKDCSNIKSMMRAIVNQLLGDTGMNTSRTSDAGDEDIASDDLYYMRKKSSTITMSMIVKWYNKVTKPHSHGGSPGKKRKIDDTCFARKPLVIMCQDLEAFPQLVLHDFIIMCSFHAATLPMVLVFGIATSWTDVSQRLLSHSAIVNLSVEKFHAPTASEHLALIIDKVLLTTEQPFKLSGKCLELIVDVFLCHDFSITSFLHALKFCALEHFREQPCSILCTKSLKEAESVISKFTKNDIRLLKSVDSFKRYVASHDKDKQTAISKDAGFKSEIKKCIHDLHVFHSFYFPALHCLHILTSSLPQYPLGKKIRELYHMCYKHDINNHEGFKQAFLLLGVSSRDQLVKHLNNCADTLESFTYEFDDCVDNDVHPNFASAKLHAFVENLEKMDENDPQPDNDEKDEEPENETLETVKYAYQLQERLRNRANKKRIRKMTRFEKIREEAISYLKSFFWQHLQRVQFMPFHEAFYFDSSAAVKRHLLAAPRLAIQTALSNPYQYLPVPSLEGMSYGVIPPNAPDICVAYKLHNECGNIINLYDWMSAFHVITTTNHGEGETNSEENKKVEIDEVTQARFIQAVSELQHLGFVKPTKKKTDHVQRLTWSHS